MFSIKHLLVALSFATAPLIAFSNSPVTPQPNPIALSIGLFNQDTPKEVEEYGKYYHLTPSQNTDHDVSFKTSDGSVLTFSGSDESAKQVVLTTKLSKKEIEKNLEKCQYQKLKDTPTQFKGTIVFEKKGSGYSTLRTVCLLTPGSPNTLTFLKVKK